MNWIHLAGNVLNLVAYWVVFVSGLAVIGHAIATPPNKPLAWIGVGLLTLPFLRSVVWLVS